MPMAIPAPTRLLVVADQTTVTPELLAVLRARLDDGVIEARLLVPNPAPAEWHRAHPERRAKVVEAQDVLDQTLPLLQEAAGVRVEGVVSTRHDPTDAIEEL